MKFLRSSGRIVRMFLLAIAATTCTLALDIAGANQKSSPAQPQSNGVSSIALPPDVHDYPQPTAPAVQETTAEPTQQKMLAGDIPEGETPIHVHIPVIAEDPHELPISVETGFAVVFVLLIASTPFVIVGFGNGGWTKSQVIQSVILFVWLIGSLYLFTNVILFNAYHFPGERTLTLVETIYLMAQVITTVGYGDITPSRERGQLFIGFFVLVSVMLIANIVTAVADVLVSRAHDFTNHVASEVAVTGRRLSSVTLDVSNDPLHKAGAGSKPTWAQAYQPPKPSFKAFIGALSGFMFFVVSGVLFYHFHPGENKTWMEAIYMSVVTLSTCGFGAFYPLTAIGKVFGAFWMLFGVGALGGVVAAFADLMNSYKVLEQWDRKTKQEEFKQLSAKLHFATPRNSDSHRIDKYEFMKFCLLHTKSAKEEHFEEMDDKFTSLGPDGKGNVTFADLERIWA